MNFRIYFTDATPDNIVVDRKSLKIAFVDLDNLLIVDSLAYSSGMQARKEWTAIHKHEKIECNGCFAYVPEELCAHHISDINLFATCQVCRG